jgi:predicted metal-dependent HD superfamily phosphohydrolase
LLTSLCATAEECRRTFADLAGRYAAAERHYHTLDHVADLLKMVASLRGAANAGTGVGAFLA